MLFNEIFALKTLEKASCIDGILKISRRDCVYMQLNLIDHGTGDLFVVGIDLRMCAHHCRLYMKYSAVTNGNNGLVKQKGGEANTHMTPSKCFD